MHGLLDASLLLLPLLPAQTIERRDGALRADITRQPVRLMDRDVELPATLIFDGQELADQSIQLTLHQPAEAADAVIDVNHIIAHLQIGIDRLRRFGNRSLAHARLRPFPAKDFRVRDQVQCRPFDTQDKAFGERGFRELGYVFGVRRILLHRTLLPELLQTVRLAGDDNGLLLPFRRE